MVDNTTGSKTVPPGSYKKLLEEGARRAKAEKQKRLTTNRKISKAERRRRK